MNPCPVTELRVNVDVYRNGLRLRRPADDKRCGRVGSKDVGSRRLPALCAVTVTGIVPGIFEHHLQAELQNKVYCVHFV